MTERNAVSALIERVREKMSDPDNVVRDPSNIVEDGGARRCVIAWCFDLDAANGGDACDAIEEHLPEYKRDGDAPLTHALRDGIHLEAMDRAIEALRGESNAN